VRTRSLAWLNIGQSLITNLMMAGRDDLHRLGLEPGPLHAGDVVLVNSLLMQLFRPLDMLGWVYRSIRQGLIDMEAMFDLLDTPAEVVDAPGAPRCRSAAGRVRFEDVRFGYEPGREILKGSTSTFRPGTSLRVVGPSGAGKSTLARLLYRFYDPTAGRITIDGQDIAEVTQASLRAAIGIVPQDTVLFNDTIGYNIGYGREARPGRDRGAARGAAIDASSPSLPDGYESMVGERGLKLSGGEKQRVAIARTLLKNPPILILDEATSALDSRTEQAIQETLDRVAESRTTIVIAHRLSTVVDADQIVVLDEGRVAERGTHAELLAQGGRGRALRRHVEVRHVRAHGATVDGLHVPRVSVGEKPSEPRHLVGREGDRLGQHDPADPGRERRRGQRAGVAERPWLLHPRPQRVAQRIGGFDDDRKALRIGHRGEQGVERRVERAFVHELGDHGQGPVIGLEDIVDLHRRKASVYLMLRRRMEVILAKMVGLAAELELPLGRRRSDANGLLLVRRAGVSPHFRHRKAARGDEAREGRHTGIVPGYVDRRLFARGLVLRQSDRRDREGQCQKREREAMVRAVHDGPPSWLLSTAIQALIIGVVQAESPKPPERNGGRPNSGLNRRPIRCLLRSARQGEEP
jgi:ABC-type multidrug transport system ATPase subunit